MNIRTCLKYSVVIIVVLKATYTLSLKSKNLTTDKNLELLKLNATINKILKPTKKVEVFHETTTPTAPTRNRTKPRFGKNFKNKLKAASPGPPTVKKKTGPKIITPELIQTWANEISEKLYKIEKLVVRREAILKSFSDVKVGVRDGTAIVTKAAKALEELLLKRTEAAERIMRKTEELADGFRELPPDYTYLQSVQLDQLKPAPEEPESRYSLPLNCSRMERLRTRRSQHYAASVSMDESSVYVTQEVYPCDERVLPSIYWSEKLLSTFRENHAEDSTISHQYFCSQTGFLRHYPAAVWESMHALSMPEDLADVFDCRLRPWYVSASGAPRDVLILLDASGSMHDSSNKVSAEKFIMALLSALTDDDQVNILRFNVEVESPIDCFNDKLVPANHINSDAMMAAMKGYKMKNLTDMNLVFRASVRMLQAQKDIPGRPESCQQAIVLLTDEMYANYSDLLQSLDPDGRIRLFTLWLHDINGLRGDTDLYGEWASCLRDGHYAELATSDNDPSHADVTQQVQKILQNLQRPLVQQRRERLRIFSDVYAHVEDPRRGEVAWKLKADAEQRARYDELRRNKDALLSPARLLQDYMYHKDMEDLGHYYEGEDVNYRLQISVAVPVFESTTVENITITLPDYPVNRLLGVAGVDIPIDDLKLILPYSELGAGGSLFIVDHRGNTVTHDNLKPLFDSNILKPGYRTMDFLELEQPAAPHAPRQFSAEWLAFRKKLIIETSRGNKTMYSKNIFEGAMRALLEHRDYHWRRVLDHYTVVVVLPKYNRYHLVHDGEFSQKLAEDAYKALHGTEFTVHPDWLYCRHVDPSFTTREDEALHFLRRRRDYARLPMRNVKHAFSPIPPSLLEKTYQCDEQLMARLSAEAVRTEPWAREHEGEMMSENCGACELGATTAFFASESGLTRWQLYHATIGHPDPPDGSAWPRGPSEPWYRRAAHSPDTLVIHAPVTPVRHMHNAYEKPPPLGIRYEWLTAARTLAHSQGGGIIGVAGYHFYPEHFEDFVSTTTDFPCNEEDEDKCEPTCDGEDWACVVVDEGGWVLAGGDPAHSAETREHLATLYPLAMAALLNASVFKLDWLHDYQAVCFPPEDESIVVSGSAIIPSVIHAVWRTAKLLTSFTSVLVTAFAFVGLVNEAKADTEKEKKKRRDKLKKDYEREKFERLFDERVIVNRSRFQACDRSRPLYEFQNTPQSLAALKRPVHICDWPLAGAAVPGTNLLLLAVYLPCPYKGRPVPDPLVNGLVKMPDEIRALNHSASRLACWRDRTPLLGRPPAVKCFPHDYQQEKGYRQCGPWVPDKPKKNAHRHSIPMVYVVFISIMLLCI
ncbi:hypothetical protein JYU34_015914 [Plutella xylostella]|uniref:VWFA domain-containing protein n=1 Tax=Plutella xylostella TaxID=51655 RepID=A0ABQ7Q510_PLUXY|nr:hypothetical protein JYU34_015914 [Plutella xylostella]